MKECRLGLLRWNKDVFGNVRARLKEIEEQIRGLKQNEINVCSKNSIYQLKREFEELSNNEELLWKQRAKALWLAEGDKNTTFFHAKEANERRIRKEVKALRDDGGNLISDSKGIKGIVEHYFAEIFRSTCPSELEIREVAESFERKVTSDMNESLLRPFVEDEIISALK
ncbi:UNVERIFIED_CONTAM: hypothetical protein Slati_2706500 [Sesamum latifolium]|uniref:Uncharacterized protein n=1 Tax=Sesamum latifolium TaxID=2727402 RepID=A0AAW2VVW9_9LAMI